MGNISSVVAPSVRERYSVVFSISLVVIVFGLVYFYNLGGWLINDDEGSFLYQAWRISEGERLYQDMLTSRWPLFLYTAAGWMSVVGMNIVLMRTLVVFLTLGTALLVFFTARLVLPTEAALLSMVVFLLHPEVFRYGRLFQPEPFYVFFSTMGLYCVVRGYKTDRKGWLAVAGLVFAIGSLYKLLAVLVLGGVGLSITVSLLRDLKSWRSVLFRAAVLFVFYIIPFGLVTAAFMLFVPRFYASVIGINMAQGQELAVQHVFFKGLIFSVGYFIVFAPFLSLVLPAAWKGWTGDKRVALFSWQLFTVLAFFVLSRDLFARLLLYLVPSLVILFAATIEPIRLLQRPVLLLAIVCSVSIPWLVTDTQRLLRFEQDTMAVVEYIDEHVPPGAHVLSDYQELNFHAHRPSTFSGAEISYVVVAGGQITGKQLIGEIEQYSVQMVILDVSPLPGNHMKALWDYDEFYAYLEEHFVLLDVLVRDDQRLEIHYRAPGLDE